MNAETSHTQSGRLPPWLRIRIGAGGTREAVRQELAGLGLHTVCESARCPNLCECWERRTATFMILGGECTRNCRFCAVPHGDHLPPPEAGEPGRVAEAAARFRLRHVVITSVTRDDLADGGAAHFAAVVAALRQRLPEAKIEVLTPDFGGAQKDLATVLRAGPDVFNHNLETCERLTAAIRSGADYRRSLAVLRNAADWAAAHAGQPLVKSGFMLGLGETEAEVHALLTDLRGAGVCILTIGQYLAPSPEHWPIARFAPPEEFAEWGRLAKEKYGFTHVASAPLVRSSYHAEAVLAAGTI